MINNKATIDMLSSMGVLQLGEFSLKRHETDPSSPLSCFKINLRLKNHGGPLTQDNIELIGQTMKRFFIEGQAMGYLGLKYPDWVAGLPQAGEPLARVISKGLGINLLTLGKEARRISCIKGSDFKPKQRVLLVDDVLSKGHSSREAIDVIEQAGLKVSHLFFVVDRQQRDKKLLRSHKHNVIRLTTISAIVRWQVKQGMLSRENAAKIKAEIGFR